MRGAGRSLDWPRVQNTVNCVMPLKLFSIDSETSQVRWTFSAGSVYNNILEHSGGSAYTPFWPLVYHFMKWYASPLNCHSTLHGILYAVDIILPSKMLQLLGGFAPRTPAGALPLDLTGGLPSPWPSNLVYHFQKRPAAYVANAVNSSSA